MNSLPKNILIIRFSAMGDVVLTVPVIKNLIHHYPETQVTVLTKPLFALFFENIPQVHVVTPNLKNEHKGVFGLWKLVNQLQKNHRFDLVIDLHAVLRTWIIGFLFTLKGIRVFRIDKGRKEKKKLVRSKNLLPLLHTTERYANVFTKAGLMLNGTTPEYLIEPQTVKQPPIKIGIAPFAAHRTKIWGLEKIYELIEKTNALYTVEWYLFGGGLSETDHLEKLAAYYPNVHNMAGKLSLSDEIPFMSTLHAFVSMDSGNMHIATLTGIPVISVWGGTHPAMGFGALYQPAANQIQIPIQELPCRPCSVFGQSTCLHKEEPYACMKRIEVEEVIQQLTAIIPLY